MFTGPCVPDRKKGKWREGHKCECDDGCVSGVVTGGMGPSMTSA